MRQAFVLMTALPPTKGHLHLAQFANALAPATVIVSTQPEEPYAYERYIALRKALRGLEVVSYHKKVEQNPEAPGFWDFWRNLLAFYGAKPGDYIVSSEPYGQRLADEIQGTFMPYDIPREIMYSKATLVRQDSRTYFHTILPEFQSVIRKRVTVFGAESTGKTTLSKDIARDVNGLWLPEWARPYLEAVGNEITTKSMTAIWRGQSALQRHADALATDKPWIIQDTDLFSTVGYWNYWNMGTPEELKIEAVENKSDLYLITQSNIPFHPDPLRYGGDKRECSDKFWIDLCEEYNLPYVVLTSDTPHGRMLEARKVLSDFWRDEVDSKFRYQRQFNS